MTEALKYEYSFNPHDDSTAARMCQLVGANKQVLELGCAAGSMSKVLQQHYGCTITGVEYDADAAALAREFCQNVVVGDLNHPELLASISQRFDVIMFSDVLEHLRNPAACLQQAITLLDDDGYVVISVPNIAHGGVIAALWCDAFNYADTGLLDRTHIHFFTTTTLFALVEDCGLIVDHVDYVDAGAWHHEFAEYWEHIPTELRQALEQHAPAQAFQILVRARRPKQAGEKSITLDRVAKGNPFYSAPIEVIAPVEPEPEPEAVVPPQPVSFGARLKRRLKALLG